MHKIYQTTVLPQLDYCAWGSLGPPSTQIHTTTSEIRRKSYNSRMVNKLPVSVLLPGPKATVYSKTHAKVEALLQNLKKESCIPPTAFTPHPQPSPRSSNSVQLFTPFVPIHAHKSSYFINIIKHWNALPDEIVSAQTPLIFKNHLHRI